MEISLSVQKEIGMQHAIQDDLGVQEHWKKDQDVS